MPNDSLLFSDFCKTCGSLHLRETLEPNDSVHYARLSCNDCSGFVKWIAKPKTNQIAISRLLQNPHLELWEKQFLKLLVHSKVHTTAETLAIQGISAKINQ
jgi:hypothetical protein